MKKVIGVVAILPLLMGLGVALAVCATLEMFGHEGVPDYV